MKIKSQLNLDRYNAFIDSRRERVLTCAVERHHIIPVSCGGTDDPSNLIDLTLREHFIAHWLMAKAFSEDSLQRAFYMMSNRLDRKASRLYQEFRAKHVEHMRAIATIRSNTPEAKEAMSNMVKGKWLDPDFVDRHKKRSKAVLSAQNMDPDFVKRKNEALSEAYKAPQFRKASFISNWNRHKDRWNKAQEFWERWVAAGKPEGTTAFCKAQGDPSTKWNAWQSFHNRFVNENWIPCEDPVWLEWSRSN